MYVCLIVCVCVLCGKFRRRAQNSDKVHTHYRRSDVKSSKEEGGGSWPSARCCLGRRYRHTTFSLLSHTRKRARAYARAHTHTHAHTRTHKHTHKHKHKHTCKHTNAHARAHTYTHAYTHRIVWVSNGSGVGEQGVSGDNASAQAGGSRLLQQAPHV